MEATYVAHSLVQSDAGEARSLDARATAYEHAPRRRPGLAKASVMIADAVAIMAGIVMARSASLQLHGYVEGTERGLLIGAATLPLWLAVFGRYRLYNAGCVSIRRAELGRLVHASLTGTLVMAGAAFFTKTPVPRSWLILCFPTILLSACLGRAVVRTTFDRLRGSGRLVRRVVLVGANDEAGAISEMTEQQPNLGYRVVGVVDDGGHRHLSQHLVSGRVEDTLMVVRATGATGVIVATTAVTSATANRLTRELMDAGVHVEMSSALRDIDAERLVVRQLGMLPMMYVEPVRRGGWRAVAKRTFDVVCSGLGLVVTGPVLALIAIATKLDSPGGAFFSQTRVGKDGQPFSVFKFRTMVKDAEGMLAALKDKNEADGPLFKLSRDPRVTRLGKHLRRLSIDEIPQLWNVLRGEMSLVGPRPALYSEMEEWSPELKQTRLRVRPGLTGMWQVSGRSSLSFSDYVRLDLYYVDNWSLWRDMAIVAKTIPRVLGQHGAY